jgi:hypothetical protein
MSDELICFLLALGIVAMMAALIPFLDLIQRLWVGTRNATHCVTASMHNRNDAKRDA